MLRQPNRAASIAAVLTCGVALTALAGTAHAQGGSPNLFHNYYVPPGPDGGVGAQLYVAPRPTPPLVGHTYVTYQPVMPHEFMTPHRRTYYRYQCDGGWTRTKVHWGFNPLNQVIRCPRQVLPNPLPRGHLAQKYGLDILTAPVRDRPRLDGVQPWHW